MTDDDRTVTHWTFDKGAELEQSGGATHARYSDPLQPPYPDPRRSVSGGGEPPADVPRTEAGRALAEWTPTLTGMLRAESRSRAGASIREAILAIEQEAAASQPSPPIAGWWIVDGPQHMTPENMKAAADVLKAAAADGLQVVTIEGITFRWRPVEVEPSPSLDVERLGFADLLDVADAILTKYPPDTIVCSHLHRADIGSRTVAAIADLIESARLAQEPEGYFSPDDERDGGHSER